MISPGLSHRAFGANSLASSWQEIWEAGPYYERISELLENAEKYAIIVGWQIDSRLPFHHQGQIETLKAKILRLCKAKPELQIYFLVWDHAYFYVLERENWQGRVWDNVHPNVHFIFDNRHPFGGSHHEKICIIDGTTAFCGGIDLCDERWDSRQHLYSDPRRSLRGTAEHHGPYHDLAIQVTGPICAELQDHVAERWRSISSVPFPDPPPELRRAGLRLATAPVDDDRSHRVYLSRTIASPDVGLRGWPLVREIEFLFRDLIAKARHRIIVEGQYYWSKEFNQALVAKIREMKGQDFEVYIILSDLKTLKAWTRHMARHELKLLEEVCEAARVSGSKLVIGSPYVARSFKQRPIYIHSKVLCIDDRYLSVGSANLSGRALRLDTEVNLTLEAIHPPERAHIERVARGMLAHWGVGHVTSRARLRHLSPTRELKNYRLSKGILARVPWSALFDPTLPWFYPMTWKFRRLLRTHLREAALMISALWFSGALFAALLCQEFVLLRSPIDLIYPIALASVWLLPIPFVPIALFSALRLGASDAASVALLSFWAAAIWGYALTRFYPTAAARYYRKTGPKWLPATLGLRNLPGLATVLFDPRASLRAKIVYQGIYSTPWPWFATGTLLTLGLALRMTVYWGGRAVLALSPPSFPDHLSKILPGLVVVVWLAALGHAIATKPWKTGD